MQEDVRNGILQFGNQGCTFQIWALQLCHGNSCRMLSFRGCCGGQFSVGRV